MPFCPFYFGVSLLKLNSRKKGTLIINGLLWNLVGKEHAKQFATCKRFERDACADVVL